MQAYGAAKARLFEALAPDASVVNTNDAFGAELASRLGGRVVRVGGAEGNEVCPLSMRIDESGIRGRVATPSGEHSLSSRLFGRHNLDNLLLVIGICEALGLPVDRCMSALSGVAGVPGRLERCDENGDDIVVLVDYAHTPDALRSVLDAVRQLARGQVHCVFGCGGDRDAAKRPLMGRAVGEAADQIIVTNDNPRTEDPSAIARAIEEGLRATGRRYDVILDRSQAISAAVMRARPGDTVLLAGKGHETVQMVGDLRRPFDDRAEARRALAARRGGS
jgi:UDP-N-acetylmuramoyl-L-alanyl-D-glutamate--2,6-diaminopimelate ligase